MPLDHYVSQVHLKNFNSSALGNRMYAIRKSDLKTFTPRSKDVCRIEDGSTNGYLRENRAIEIFLRTIEPKYNAALATLRDGEPDQQAVYAVAGFVACVSSCAPAAIRIGASPLKAVLHTTAEILDRKGELPHAPQGFGNRTMTELLNDGIIHFKVDGKYPQAIGISTILNRLSVFGNSAWEILRNKDADRPFFTSDFPVAIEARGHSGIINRVVPLAPDLAVRILPDVGLSRAKPDLSFSKFRYRDRIVGRDELNQLNKLIVQCAEDIVFYSDNQNWIAGFVAENRSYRIECVTTRIPWGAGTMHVASQRILPADKTSQ